MTYLLFQCIISIKKIFYKVFPLHKVLMWTDTWLAELMVHGAKKSWSGVYGPEDTFLQDQVTTWLRSLERDECGWRTTGLFSEPWGSKLEDSLCPSVDVFLLIWWIWRDRNFRQGIKVDNYFHNNCNVIMTVKFRYDNFTNKIKYLLLNLEQ